MRKPGFLAKIDKEIIYVVSIFIFFICGYIITTDLPIILFSQNQIDPRSLTGVYDTRTIEGIYYGTRVSSQSVNGTLFAYNVLGTSGAPKHIEIDLANQQLYAFEGSEKVFSFLISSGRWNRTPTGTFHVWEKLRYGKMTGGSVIFGTYYNLPNVPYAIYFSNNDYPDSSGYSINGTYWQKNFGRPTTNGSIDMQIEDAAKLFYWVDPVITDKPSVQETQNNPGTPVVIYGTAPQS
jgi:hypothetical protein